MRFLLLIAALTACPGKDPPGALDYVSLCAPGRSFERCDDGLRRDRRATKPALPKGDLVSIKNDSVGLIDNRVPLMTPSTMAYRYSMTFRDGYGTVRARVMALLESELGRPTRITGAPPIADPGVPDGDYWVSDDGLWICSNVTVTWYSKPIIGVTVTWSDRYLQKAPTSGPLWNKVGHLLVTY